MSEEEKKAIEELNNRQGYRVNFKCKRCNSGDVFIIPPEVLYGKEIDILLNLIDRLQKELDKEKETSHYIQSQLDIANAKLLEEKEKNNLLAIQDTIDIFYERKDKIKKYYVSKDKIREILTDVIFTLNLPDVSNETKFYMTGVKNSLEDLLREN